jgi:hypothetical protein
MYLIGILETTRKNIENSVELSESSENIKLISEHVPTHRKPLTDEEFYLIKDNFVLKGGEYRLQKNSRYLLL